MTDFDVYLIKAMRECNRRILELEKGKLPGRVRDSGEYGTVNYLLINKIDPAPRSTDFLSDPRARTEAARLIYEAVRGGKPTSQSRLFNYKIDGSQLNLAELLALKKRLETVYTAMTGIPAPDAIETDDELRNINSYEYLRLLVGKIPNDLHSLRGFKKVVDLCSENTKYDSMHPYGNYYTAFLLALEAHIRNLREQRKAELIRIEKVKREIAESKPPKPVYHKDIEERILNYINSKLSELDPLIELVYSNPNYAIDRAYSMIRDDVQQVRQTDEHELKAVVEKRLTRGGSAPHQRKRGVNVDTPRSAEFPLARLWANISSRFKPMMTTSQPSEIHLHYKKPGDPLQIRFGTQGQIDRSRFHANPLFEQYLEMKQRKYDSEKKGEYESAHLARLRHCSLMVMSEPPTLASLHRLGLKSNAAFVRVNDNIYYVNQAAAVCTKLTLEHGKKTKFQQAFDKAALQTNETRELKANDLRSLHDHITPIHAETQGVLNPDHAPPRILHIYFNNLSRVGGAGKKIDIENKDREAYLTRELEGLERSHENTAIITLPSDKGLLNHHLAGSRGHPEAANYDSVKDRILAITNNTSGETYAGDFYISTKIKAYLYGDGLKYKKETETAILKELIDKSFAALGFKPGDRLSPADQQAVYFYFIKFELTDFIITKLGPESFNFSCKDAIDRGGVSSAYYNLIKSIKSGNPITQEEFERLLHGAPTLVKGRGLNKHTQLIWNAVDAYVEANKHIPGFPVWLIAWRDKHALPGTPQYHINELQKYITTREGESEYFTFFGRRKAMTKDVKVETAKDVIASLKTLKDKRHQGESVSLKFDDTLKIKAAQDKRLGKIITTIEKDGMLSIERPDTGQRHRARGH